MASWARMGQANHNHGVHDGPESEVREITILGLDPEKNRHKLFSRIGVAQKPSIKVERRFMNSASSFHLCTHPP